MIDIGHIIAIHGYRWETKDFFNAVGQLYVTEFKPVFGTVEVFLCNPKFAIDFCNRVRKITELHALPDNVILTCLVNLRKRKFLIELEKTIKKNTEHPQGQVHHSKGQVHHSQGQVPSICTR